MKLSPGDQIQIILTVGGVPYAKTGNMGDDCEIPIYRAASLMGSLLTDIDLYGDEHEEENDSI